MLPALLLASAAAGPVPGETDIPYQGDATWVVGAHTLRVEGQRLLGPEGRLLASRLTGPPVADTHHLCAADEGLDGLGQLRCWDGSLQAVTLVVGGRPGRLALGGAMLGWVASPEGLPQVFVAPVDGSAAPRALTNVGLTRVPGRAPEGFVPPPLGASLRFDGDLLRWDTPEGPREVRWR